MKHMLLTAALLACQPAQAGGPVIIEDAYEAEPAPKLTPGEKIALAAGLLILGGLLLGNGGGDGAAACTCNDRPDDGGSCGC